MALRAGKVSRAFKKRAPGALTLVIFGSFRNNEQGHEIQNHRFHSNLYYMTEIISVNS